MRRLLAIPALLAVLLLAAPVSAADPVTYACHCGPPTGTGIPCEFNQNITSDDQGRANTMCVEACATVGKVLCKNEKAVGNAATPGCPDGRTVCLKNPLNTSNVPQIIGSIIKAAVGVVGAFALLTFVYGGFLWLTSGGDAGKVEQGKEAMKWAIIGLAVVFSSYALVSFVLSALKL